MYTPKTKEELEELKKIGFNDGGDYYIKTGIGHFKLGWFLFNKNGNWIITLDGCKDEPFYPRSKEHLKQIILAFKPE